MTKIKRERIYHFDATNATPDQGMEINGMFSKALEVLGVTEDKKDFKIIPTKTTIDVGSDKQYRLSLVASRGDNSFLYQSSQRADIFAEYRVDLDKFYLPLNHPNADIRFSIVGPVILKAGDVFKIT